MLKHRGRQGDKQRAASIERSARRTIDAIGMKDLSAQAAYLDRLFVTSQKNT
jgi:hypothetical protein